MRNNIISFHKYFSILQFGGKINVVGTFFVLDFERKAKIETYFSKEIILFHIYLGQNVSFQIMCQLSRVCFST